MTARTSFLGTSPSAEYPEARVLLARAAAEPAAHERGRDGLQVPDQRNEGEQCEREKRGRERGTNEPSQGDPGDRRRARPHRRAPAGDEERDEDPDERGNRERNRAEDAWAGGLDPGRCRACRDAETGAHAQPVPVEKLHRTQSSHHPWWRSSRQPRLRSPRPVIPRVIPNLRGFFRPPAGKSFQRPGNRSALPRTTPTPTCSFSPGRRQGPPGGWRASSPTSPARSETACGSPESTSPRRPNGLTGSASPRSRRSSS